MDGPADAGDACPFLSVPFLSLALWVGKREGDRLRGCVYTCNHYYGVESFRRGLKVEAFGAGSSFSTFIKALLREVGRISVTSSFRSIVP